MHISCITSCFLYLALQLTGLLFLFFTHAFTLYLLLLVLTHLPTLNRRAFLRKFTQLAFQRTLSLSKYLATVDGWTSKVYEEVVFYVLGSFLLVLIRCLRLILLILETDTVIVYRSVWGSVGFHLIYLWKMVNSIRDSLWRIPCIANKSEVFWFLLYDFIKCAFIRFCLELLCFVPRSLQSYVYRAR